MTTNESFYYVAKQSDRKFGVYFPGLYGSRLQAMFRTRREAVAECRKLNAFHRIELQIAAERAAERGES